MPHLPTILTRRLQQMLRTDINYLTRGGLWLSLSYLLQISAGIITVTVLANLLPKSVFGTYQFILAMAAVISVFTLSGLTKAVTRAVAQGNDGILRAAVQTKMKWNVGIVLVAGAVASYYAWQGNVPLATAFAIVGACVPFIESFKLYNPFLHGKEAFRDSTLLGFWRKPLPLIAVCVTAYYTHDVVALIAAYFVSSAVSYTAVYVAVIGKYRPPHTSDTETVTYSKHLSVIALISKAALHADKIIIWQFLGSVAVASFSLAQLAVRYAGGLLNVLATLALPKLAKRDIATLHATLPRKVLLFAGVMVVCVAGYLMLAPWLFAILFPSYPEAVLMSQLLAVGLLFIPQALINQVFTAHAQVASQYVLGLIVPTIKIGLTLLLVWQFGVWGVIAASIATDALSFVLSYYLFTRLPKTSEAQ